MCSENTEEGETNQIQDGLDRVGNNKRNHTWFQVLRRLQSNREETHEHSKLQSDRYKCHKRGIKYYKGSEDIKGTSNQDDLRNFLKKMKYEWAFRKLLHLSRAERRGYKSQLPSPCTDTA